MAARKFRPVRFRHEFALMEQGITRVAGVDEAGRGPLAGPVFAAAVVLPVEWILGGLPKPLKKINDSKQLTPELREVMFQELTSRPEVHHAIAHVPEQMIDQINIYQASHRAMNLALAQLDPPPQHVLVDGLRVKSMTWPQTAIVSGDAWSYSIGAASILAKVSRDRLMIELDGRYPGYGFASHKGYATPQHVAAIKALGPSAIHRQSFWPFRPTQGEMFDEDAPPGVELSPHEFTGETQSSPGA
jgi:ribonuclease HII